jgi:hypothetical protein
MLFLKIKRKEQKVKNSETDVFDRGIQSDSKTAVFDRGIQSDAKIEMSNKEEYDKNFKTLKYVGAAILIAGVTVALVLAIVP